MECSLGRNIVLLGVLPAALTAILVATAGCSRKEPAAPGAQADATAQAPAPAATQPVASVPQILKANDATWTPEAMEDLLAPVALYPDVVLGQVLVAATNPQEVLDAGNWLLQNQNLQGNDLDEAAKKMGFTPPIRGLMQSPEVVDMMCSELGWTTELGQAFVNDQQGALDAVQRLRAQAKDVGNLRSSDKMTVGTETQDGQQVITVSPPSPQVVYVPQYDPVAAYAPPPPAAATTTTTESTGHSTGAMVATGLLAFGAGILVANIFNDDDDDYYRNGYYNPRYYGPPMPYYPPYPYRPNYGNTYRPSYGYSRPPNYQHSFNNNTTIIVNNTTNSRYWDRHEAPSKGGYNAHSVQSPITAAKPYRPELNTLNAQANQRPTRQAPTPPQTYKGQSTYAGAKPVGAAAAKPAVASPAQRPSAAPDRSAKSAAPAVNKSAPRPAANPPSSTPQHTRPAAPPTPKSAPSKPSSPAAKPAKPTKPKAVPAKPKSAPAKPQPNRQT